MGVAFLLNEIAEPIRLPLTVFIMLKYKKMKDVKKEIQNWRCKLSP